MKFTLLHCGVPRIHWVQTLSQAHVSAVPYAFILGTKQVGLLDVTSSMVKRGPAAALWLSLQRRL